MTGQPEKYVTENVAYAMWLRGLYRGFTYGAIFMAVVSVILDLLL